MPAKKVNFRSKTTPQSPGVEQWVQARGVTTEQSIDKVSNESTEKLKRLTLDIPESLHKAIKGKAVTEGRTMVDMLRELLEETYG